MAHHGAVAFWDKVVHKTNGSGGTPEEYHWIEAIHDRDYKDYELGISQPRWLFQPTTSATDWVNSAPDGIIAHGIPQPAGITVNEGYLHDAGSNSPLAKRRANDEGKEPDRASGHLVPTSPHTCQTSVEVDSSKPLQGLPVDQGGGFLNPVRGLGDFPFTLEAWVKDATDGLILGVSPWMDPAADGSSNEPASTWRFVGVGLHTGIPIAMWGGFDPNPVTDISATPGQDDVYFSYPDINLTRGTDGTPWTYNAGALSQTLGYSGDSLWHHVVLIVRGQDHIQLFYDGRCILNAKDYFWYKNVGMTGGGLGNFAKFNDTDGAGSDCRIFKMSQFSAPHKFAMQVGGLTHHWESGGSPQTRNIHHLHGVGDASVAACSTYARALTDEEILDHYVTMTQAFTIKLLGDSSDTRADDGAGAHTDGYWVGPQGIREVTPPNTWGSGTADMFGMFHDRLWRDASQPTMEFLYKPGQAALVCSTLTNTEDLTQVETWSQVADHRTDWRVEGDSDDWEHSRGWGLMICAAPVYFCTAAPGESEPTYPWCNAPSLTLPSWVGEDAAAQVGSTATWEYKLFDSFGGSLNDQALTTEGTGGLLRIGKEASGSTVHNYWLYGQTGLHGTVTAYQHSGYEGDVRTISKIEDRRFGVFSTAQHQTKLYGLVNLSDTTILEWPADGPGSFTNGSVRSVDLSAAGLSHPLRLFQAADGVDYTADTDTNARGCQEPLIRLGLAVYFKHGALPPGVGGHIDRRMDLQFPILERAIRGKAPIRGRQSTQAPRRWFHCTRMALPRNARTRLREHQP
jgi:hypothetical protein